jgi:heat shock protein HtpX
MTSNWNLGRGRLLLDNIKTVVLLICLAGIAGGVGFALGGIIGTVIAVAFMAFLLSVGFRIPGGLIMRLYGGVPLQLEQAPELFAAVRKISVRAGVNPPTLYLIPAMQPNALAVSTGKDVGALAVTQGALRLFSEDELHGVLAHEISHLKHRDTVVLQAVGLMSNTMSTILKLALWIGVIVFLFSGAGATHLLILAAMALVVPVLVVLVHATIARTREFAADHLAAQITGNPMALADALEKLEAAQPGRFKSALGGRRGSLFRSHPSTAARVERLRDLSREDIGQDGEPRGNAQTRRRARRVGRQRYSERPSYVPMSGRPSVA